MRRTLLLILAVPVVLFGAGLVTMPSGTSPSVDEERRPSASGPTTSTSTSTSASPAPAPTPAAPAPVPPPAVRGDTSDGADAAAGSDGDADDDQPILPIMVSDEGFLIAPGGLVSGSGPRWRYTVEVEPETGFDLDEVALQVEAALHDDRSWVATRTLEQVDDPAAARIRVVLATPDTVDRLCAQVGLRTVGIYSCWNGRFAALNAWRWEVGAEGFDDMLTYRRYLVNHEFGHGLGYGHVGCPSPGASAPVMMQQSKTLDGCTANGWPYP